MRFKSGLNLRKFKFTVYDTPPILDPVTGQRKMTSLPMRAIFKYGDEHTFDSLEAQKEYGWTDEQREKVETELQDPRHGYFGQLTRRGIWLEEETPAEAPVDKTQCIGFSIVDGHNGKEPMRCENVAVEGALFCAEHNFDPNEVTVAECYAVVDGEPCSNPVVEGSDYCSEHQEAEVSA